MRPDLPQPTHRPKPQDTLAGILFLRLKVSHLCPKVSHLCPESPTIHDSRSLISVRRVLLSRSRRVQTDAGSSLQSGLCSGVRVFARSVLLRSEHQDGWQCRADAEIESIRSCTAVMFEGYGGGNDISNEWMVTCPPEHSC
jgi:hypothetical protein